MTTDHVYPEDQGTGASVGDDADAANFASLIDNPRVADLVVTGLSFSVTYGTPEFDLSAGKCKIRDASAPAAQTAQTRDQNVVYSVEIDSRSGLSLTDNAVNDIYVDVDLSTDDYITIDARTSGTPNTPYLKIGEIDTGNDAKTETNRLSGGPVNRGTATKSGDGSTTSFSISHAMNQTPSWADVTPSSEDASTDFYVSNITSTDIEITYAAAPANGSNNLSYYWEVEV